MTQWIQKGLYGGYGNGIYKPNQSIKKAEFFTLVNRVFGFSEKGDASFADVREEQWFYEDICKAVAADYIKGSPDGMLHPNTAITRQEVAVILYRIFDLEKYKTNSPYKFTDRDQVAPWGKEAIITLESLGYINGYKDNTFRPGDGITRAEVIAMISNISGEIINKQGIYSKKDAKSLLININDVVLEDTEILEDLYLTEGIGEGDLSFQNINVGGKVLVGNCETTLLK